MVTLFTVVLVTCGFLSAALALVLVFLFIRVYKLLRFSYLIGLPIGFSFLAFGYVSLALFLAFAENTLMMDFFLWLRLISQTYGFAFIAFSYHFFQKTEERTRFSLAIVSFASVVSVLFVFAALMVTPPFLELPDLSIVSGYFRVATLFLLSYTIYRIVRQFESSVVTRGLIWGPFAFWIFWLSEYSFLIWGIDGSQTAFVLAHVMRLLALIMFIAIYFVSGKTHEG
jgi:hypothetical protein